MTDLEKHYRENFTSLVNYYRRYMGQDSEDLVQEAYTRILEYGKEVKNFDAMFKRVIENIRIDWHRKKSTAFVASKEMEVLFQDIMDVNEPEVMGLEMALINKKLSEKKGHTRDILFFAIHEGMSVKEIVELINANPATVYKTLSRFKEELLNET